MAQVTNQDVRSGKDSEAIFDKYNQLPARGIRLLELLPPQSRFSRHELQCKIIDSNLESRDVQYEALSYCWGTVKPEKRYLTIINYGNHKFKVTDSLAQAFETFRRKDKSRLIWADFLCINQKDSDEKGVQVGLMTDIYAGAFGVLAWVGSSKPEHGSVFEMDQHFSEKAHKANAHELDSVMALGRFLEADWFSRMWIIQEACQARRLTLCSGEKSMDWSKFCHILENMLSQYGFLLNTSRTDAAMERIMTLISIRNLVTEHLEKHNSDAKNLKSLSFDRLDHQRPKPVVAHGDFVRFVSHARLFGATDQRDRIHALRGLVLDEEKGYAPDYKKPTEQTFEGFALFSMKHNANLHLLSQAGLHANCLPSWVPDWSRRLHASPLNIEAYHASPALYMAKKPVDSRGLVVGGHRIDRISQLLPGFDNCAQLPMNEPTTRKAQWTPGEQPRHEKLQLFERSISDMMAVISPLSQMVTEGASGLTQGPKMVKELVTKVASIPSAMKNRTKRISFDDEQPWRSLALQLGNNDHYPDVLAAYKETLIGGMPIPALGPDLNHRFREKLYDIWRERSTENPIVTKGTATVRNMKGQTKTGEAWIPCPMDLKIAYFDGAGKRNSDSMDQNREKFKQTGGSMWRPILTDRKVYEAGKGIKSLFKGKEEKPDQSGWSEYEKRVHELENADPYYKAKDDQEAKQYLARLYSRAVERMAGHRKFAVTETGYIGWVSEAAQLGDEIWILDGGNVPYVLRSSGVEGEYALIGESFVQGLMTGEFFRTKDSGQLLEQKSTMALV